jgi:hypothetical protein
VGLFGVGLFGVGHLLAWGLANSLPMLSLPHLPASVLRLVSSFATDLLDIYLAEAAVGVARLARKGVSDRTEAPSRQHLLRHVFRSTHVVEDVAFTSRGVSYLALDLRRDAAPFAIPESSSVQCAMISVLCSSFCVAESGPDGFTLLCRGAQHDGHMLRWLRVDRARAAVSVQRELFVAADDSLPLSCRVGVEPSGVIQLSSMGLREVTTLSVCGRSGHVLSSVVSGEPCRHVPLGEVGLLAVIEPERISFVGARCPAPLPLAARDLWVVRGDSPGCIRIVVPLRREAHDGSDASTEALVFRVSADASPPLLLSRLTLPWPQCASMPFWIEGGASRLVQEGAHAAVLLLRVKGGTLMVDVDAARASMAPDRKVTLAAQQQALISPVAVSVAHPDPGVAVVCAQVLRQQEARLLRR